MPVMTCPWCGGVIPIGPLAAKCRTCGYDSSRAFRVAEPPPGLRACTCFQSPNGADCAIHGTLSERIAKAFADAENDPDATRGTIVIQKKQ